MSPEPAPDPLRDAIHQLLVGDDTLTALLSAPEAVRHRLAAGDEPPYLIFHVQSPGVPVRTFGAVSEQPLWLVKGVCRGHDASPAEAINARCQELLDGVKFEVAGAMVTSLRVGGVDYGEPKDGDVFQHVGSLYRIYA